MSFTMWTWGFEIEGCFARSLRELQGNFVHDGSVSIRRTDNHLSETEYQSPVCSFKRMLELLANFNKKTYNGNETCGLHIHIAPKNDEARMLRYRLASTDGLKLVNRLAMDLDEWQAERMAGSNYFFKKYGSNALNDWTCNEKYRQVRNHPQGTLEFRLFSPLGTVKEREQRIVSFFSLLFDELHKEKYSAIREIIKTEKPKLCAISL